MSNAKNAFERQGTAKELDEETGLYYYGARYLKPKYSMWISCDPALSDYMAGSSAGCGGVFNHINFNLYHYGGNNPIRYTDPTGMFDFDTNTIEEGDTLSQIAKDCNTLYGTNYTEKDLQRLNSNTISDVNKIYAGNHLNLGKAEEVQKRAADYTSRATTQYSNAALVIQQDRWTRADTENVLSWCAVGLSVANGACMVLCPAACPFLIGGILIVDSINFGCKIADAKEEGLNLKTGAGLVTGFSSIVLDGIGFGIANNWIKSSSMLLNLRFNQGANRFIRANGRFMPFIEGKIYWAIDYVGIPLFLGQF